MARVIKVLQTIRNNWKKSVFAVCAVSYGVDYAMKQHQLNVVMRAYCEGARELGEKSVLVPPEPRHITVILNPAANKRKAKKQFEKYVAPLLYLSGNYINVIETEREGHAKQILNDIKSKTNAIVIAGGDGTVSETLTGLMRSRGELCNVPVGVIPLGVHNSLANSVFKFESEDGNHYNDLAKATMAVLNGNTKKVNVLRVQVISEEAEEAKPPVYAVAGLKWGLWEDMRKRESTFWYLGPLKRYVALVFPGPASQSQVSAKVRYSPPCSGCSSCFSQRPDLMLDHNAPAKRSWWFLSSLSRKPQEKPRVDYSKIINPECSKVESKDIDTAHLNIHVESEGSSICKLVMDIAPPAYEEYYTEGVHRINGEPTSIAQTIEAKQIELRPVTEPSEESETSDQRFLTIDNESFQLKPVLVSVLPNSLQIFC